MSYGTESHDGLPSYEVILEHPSTGMQARVMVVPMYGSFVPSGDPVTDEALRDQLFQQVLTDMANLGVMTVVSATKRGNYLVPVTP